MKDAIESPDKVHARILRIAAEAAEEGQHQMVIEICEQVIKEVQKQLPHWE